MIFVALSLGIAAKKYCCEIDRTRVAVAVPCLFPDTLGYRSTSITDGGPAGVFCAAVHAT